MQYEYQGVLKFMHPKGYGFIASDTGEDHFVHRRDLIDSHINCDLLEDGRTRFGYDLTQDTKNGKMKATNLVVLS